MITGERSRWGSQAPVNRPVCVLSLAKIRIGPQRTLTPDQWQQTAGKRAVGPLCVVRDKVVPGKNPLILTSTKNTSDTGLCADPIPSRDNLLHRQRTSQTPALLCSIAFVNGWRREVMSCKRVISDLRAFNPLSQKNLDAKAKRCSL